MLGKEFICRKLEWDGELAAGLVAAERHFWESYVEKGALPPPDGSKAFDAVLEQYFHAAEKKSAVELVGFDGKPEGRNHAADQRA